ncbi:MAG: S9 family peptidase, partial [Sphingobacteriales bacterium]
DIYKMAGHSEMVRVESSQWCMQDSYFEHPAAYEENSPLQHASRINTPLLLWTGKEDPNVNPHQSMQAYLALRRMGKPGMLYQFDGEGHSLQLESNRKALSAGIKAWFDSYLK